MKGKSGLSGDLNVPNLELFSNLSISELLSAGFPWKLSLYIVLEINGKSLMTVGWNGGFKVDEGFEPQFKYVALYAECPSKGR